MVAKKKEHAEEMAEVKKPTPAPAPPPPPLVPEKNPGEEFVDIEALGLKAVQIAQLGVLIKDGPWIVDATIFRTGDGKFTIKG